MNEISRRRQSGVMLLLVAGLLCGLACRGKSEAPAARVVQAPTAPEPSGAVHLVVMDAANHQVLEVSRTGETITVVGDAGARLVGEIQSSGKRKYRLDNGGVVAEVKTRAAGPADEDATGFKLRGPDGSLLWKVKVTAEKIKISADEEGSRSWALSLKHENKVKVSDPDGKEIGSVKIKDGAGRVEMRDGSDQLRFVVPGVERSAAFGVLLIDAISNRDKGLLVAELVARGN